MLSFIDNFDWLEASMVTSSTSRSCARRARITIALLVLAIGFTALVLVSVVSGLFRQGDSLLYGDSITVPMQVSADDLGQLPYGISADDWIDVDVTIQDVTTSQMLLRSAQDLGPAVVIVWALWLLAAVLNAALPTAIRSGATTPGASAVWQFYWLPEGSHSTC